MSETLTTIPSAGLAVGDVISIQIRPQWHWLVRAAAWATGTNLPEVVRQRSVITATCTAATLSDSEDHYTSVDAA